MTFEALLKKSRLKDFAVYKMADPTQEIHGVQLLTGNETEFMPHIIYFGYQSAFPQSLNVEHTVNFFCCLSGPMETVSESALDASFQRTNFIVLPNVDDIFSAYNTVNEPVVQDLAHHDTMRHLILALFSDQGLQYLVDTAFRVLGNPIIVVDMSSSHLAIAPAENPSDDPDSIISKLWQDHYENKSANQQSIVYDKENEIMQKLRRRTSPYVYHHELLGCRVMVSLVLVHGVELARVTMLEHFHPFGQGDSFMFSNLARYIGQELSKNIFYKTNKGRSRSYFLLDLLNNLQMTPKTISRRLASLDYTIYDSLYVAIFRQRSILTHNLQQIDIAFVADKISGPILSGHLYAVSNDELVVLFNFAKGQEWRLPSLKSLTRYAGQMDCLWGVSNEFHSLENIHMAYAQARSAIDFGNQYFFIHEICPIRLVVFYKHISTIAMLESSNKTQSLEIFIDPSLMELKAYDDVHHTEYLLTLHAFLQCGLDRKRAAERLHIHKNTMTYRCNKLMELLNTSFDNGEELHRYYLSLRIMMFLNMVDFSQFFK